MLLPAIALVGPLLVMVNKGFLLTAVTACAFIGVLPVSCGVAVAVFVKVPSKSGFIVPVTVTIILFDVPAVIFPVTAIVFPVPVAPAVIFAVPSICVVQLTLVKSVGTASVICVPIALLGPLLET